MIFSISDLNMAVCPQKNGLSNYIAKALVTFTLLLPLFHALRQS